MTAEVSFRKNGKLGREVVVGSHVVPNTNGREVAFETRFDPYPLAFFPKSERKYLSPVVLNASGLLPKADEGR